MASAAAAYFIWRGAAAGRGPSGSASLVLARDCPLVCARARAARDPAELAEWFRSRKTARIILESECRKAPDWTPLSSELYIHFFRLYTRPVPPAPDAKRRYDVLPSPGPRRNLGLDEPPCLVELLRPGDRLAAAGDFAGALRAFRALESRAPGLPALAARIAAAHARLGEFAKAESCMEKALMLAGPLPELYSELGEIYAKSGRSADAAGAFEKAAGLDPGSAARWIRLARAFRKLGDSGKASAALGSALAIDPRDPEALALGKEMK